MVDFFSQFWYNTVLELKGDKMKPVDFTLSMLHKLTCRQLYLLLVVTTIVMVVTMVSLIQDIDVENSHQNDVFWDIPELRISK